MDRDQYMHQRDLLVRPLPFIVRHEAFVLKGGTAINLLCSDMPRLSVDVDQSYLPIEGRETSTRTLNASERT
ncbi:nucleotidyl transferase AbiEii/AbiGii toxin family protein [Rhizobium sp. BR 314]|uniref:nucleotidyl transferase AbiEii/AbiGii toxin family protein n=1 Tax=Rhizobium sp. BR 314 TaxID=3040013 RepID=UPI0039BF14F1